MLASRKGSVLLFGCVLVCLIFVLAVAAQPPRLLEVAPLHLAAVTIPAKTLPAAPSGGTPSNAEYTVTSAQAPFCLAGFRISANEAGGVVPGQDGDVDIHLEYIDGNGVSYSAFKLFNSTTGGFSPQDLVVSQGSQICANRTIAFHAILWQAQIGPGVAMTLSGQAIVLTAAGNTVTVQ